MELALEREVLGGRQREARRQQPLDRRIIGQVDEQHRAVELPAVLERTSEEAGFTVGDAHGGEDDHEGFLLVVRHPGLGGDASGELSGGEPEPGEDGELLAADEGVHPIDRRHTGLDEFRRVFPSGRVDRKPVHVPERLRHDGGTSVDRHPRAIEHAPQQVDPDAQTRCIPAEADRRGGEVEPAGAGEHLDHGALPVDFENLPAAHLAVRRNHVHDLLRVHATGVIDEDQRSGHVVDGLVFDRVEPAPQSHRPLTSSSTSAMIRAAASSMPAWGR